MKYPKHVALIPDGNRTWAKELGKSSFEGHLEGFQRVIELVQYLFSRTKVEVFTVWGLSTENLKNRTDSELSYLFSLYKKITEDLYDFLDKESINFRLVGDRTQLPNDLVDFLEEKENNFNYPNKKTLVLAINYGGQDEIIRAVRSLFDTGESVNQENLEKYMDFGGLPPVDLVIRTKQKLAKRLSGFMLWWIGYAQLYFTDLYCPDFSIEEFNKALDWWNQSLVTQNFGK